ncbi:gluconate:H+ symporter [Daejeonella lutea]|uniref:Gnt-I system high-affinity gluconate transporter n=1 Tax=Daejeonella lutea TaxID=572036 RepID=A0A1T5F7G2_9SPHI|nr:gluconate:H+ symporter [Daejeonella lutea]SKB92083.1 Gnt-I system high-affinity gluconate transporter [Daejeonella lutea]
MSLLIVLFGLILLLVLIVRKLSPMIALLLVSIITGLLLGMPVAKVMTTIGAGIGGTLGSMVMVLALGAMMGKLIEDTGAAKKIVFILIRFFGYKNIQWAILLTGLLVGIPLFYNAGFVVLVPLVFAIASATRLPLLYLALPMAASLSVTHGFLPPHPGPIALASIFKADVGYILIYGLILSVPIAIAGGIIFPRLILKSNMGDIPSEFNPEGEELLPSGLRSFTTALLPVVLIIIGTIGTNFLSAGAAKPLFVFLSDPTVALLIAVLVTIIVQRIPITKAMDSCTEGVKSIAMIILIIAAGGAFKQVLIDSGVGDTVKSMSASLELSPLFLAWLITALLRVTLGSATVAGLTASGIVLPLVGEGVSPELMVLSVGAGSLMFSHVNDTGFWMFKEYFNLTLKQTFGTWTIMESIVSLLGLAGVLIINQFI